MTKRTTPFDASRSKDNVANLVALRDRHWHTSINGGLCEWVRAKARRLANRYQREIERIDRRDTHHD